MYVNRGMGQARALPRRPGGPMVIPIPRGRGFGIIRGGRRGMGASGSTALTCTSPNYWNGSIGTCCAPLGTAPADDPCSILNSQAFLQAQANDVGPLNSSGVPISAGTGAGGQELAEVANYPNNVQTDAIQCWNNPGATFVDSLGLTITCPSASLNQDGILVSAYSAGQLASMISAQATPLAGSPNLAGNNPYATPAQVNGDPVPVTSSVTPTVRLVNSSGGSNSSFNVGDSWQITITGSPNAVVQASATQNGTSLGTTNMGTIGANGQLVLTGTFAASQVGSWTESWMVGSQSAGSISFSVGAGSGSSTSTGGSSSTAGGGSGVDLSTVLSGTVTVGGVSIPYWALGVGALGLLWFMGGRR